MPITFTSGLTPTHPANSFGSEKTHVKELATSLVGGTAFLNPLAAVVTTLVNRITAVQTLLATEISVSQAQRNTLNGYVSGTLPTGWTDATADGQSGYLDANMTALANNVGLYYTEVNGLNTKLTTLKNYLSQVDVDNFKLHMELLSGVDVTVPPSIEKPIMNSLMGLAQAITDTENRFGIVFTNYLTGLFGTLFTGDVTVASAQTHMDTDPLSGGTYVGLDVLTNVNKAYVQGATGDARVWNDAIASPKITTIKTPVTTYTSPQDTHLAAFTSHVTTDMAYYNTVLEKLKSYIQAYGVSSHIKDPYYRFMYTDVFGSSVIQDTITRFSNGEIT